MTKKKDSIHIAIIGLGPRGLSVFERFIANFQEFSSAIDANINLHLFDSNMPGVGCHSIEQPEYLLVNTVASQITQFSDASVRDAGPVFPGPSFYDWLVKHHKNTTEVPNPNAYYSRALFGKYLNWVFKYLLSSSSDLINVYHHLTAVEDISKKENGSWVLYAKDKTVNADYIFLTTGHTYKNSYRAEKDLEDQMVKLKAINPFFNVIDNPYPIKEKLSNIEKPAVVAIEGAGLTACDIVAELTVGRGGRFFYVNDKLNYQASKREPRILLISRSGIPLSARAVNQKGIGGQYKPRVMSIEKIQLLKAQHGKLDFEQHVFPLLCLEMSYVYYTTLIRNNTNQLVSDQFGSEFINAIDETAREQLVHKYFDKDQHFLWDRLENPIPKDLDQTTFVDWLFQYLREDVRNAKQGNVDNPLKAACDVLRDLRDVLRSAIDFASLSESSHLKFIQKFVPIMNRLAVGPPYTRVLEWLALMEAEILQFNLGPYPHSKIDKEKAQFCFSASTFKSQSIYADVFIKARVDMPSPLDDKSPLMQSMLRKKLVTPFKNKTYHPGGIEISPQYNIVSQNGKIIKNIWALGILTEGCKFYTFVVPRPEVNSTAIVDAGRAVRQMFAQILHKKSATKESVIY